MRTNEMVQCVCCHEPHPEGELIYLDDELYCEDCLGERTVTCQRCGERIWEDDDAGDENTHLCRSCFNRYYVRCCQCENVVPEEDACYPDDDFAHPYCERCTSQYRDEKTIHDYYKPEPIFYGHGPRYFGVELEIDGAGEDEDNAQEILEIGNREEEYCYCKHDGSLDDGFEIVTHPQSLSCQLAGMPWKDILEKARSLGYTSHQARTCGLHVHVSRKAFGETETEQDPCIARILYIFEKFWDEFLKFSRRTHGQVAHWAARYGMKEHPGEILKHAKKDCEGIRYTCVNLCNQGTIEFRIFRGTLKFNTVIATLQMVNRICDVALFMSDEEVKNMSWTTFAAGCSEPELVQYLKERRLYVNEPVVTEEEV